MVTVWEEYQQKQALVDEPTPVELSPGYGRIIHRPTMRPHPVWLLHVKPHIAVRIKRMFPRARQQRTEWIEIVDTPEVARDLEWLLQRYPLDMDAVTAEHLRARADEDRNREEKTTAVLDGHRILGLRDPIREPRPYQLQAADLTLATGRLLLADDVGLGKTFSGLLILRDPHALPALVVTLTHLPKQWLREIELSLPWLKAVAVTKGQPYDLGDADVIVMNYHKLQGWANHLSGLIKTCIFDEIQELRHDGTYKYEAAGLIADQADWKIGLSATPVYNYGGEIHSIMSILSKDALGTREEFLREWGGVNLGNGRSRVQNPAALGTYLRDQGLMLRRTRKDVHRELPDPLKIVHEVDSDPEALNAVAGDVAAMARLVLDKTADNTDRFRAAGELDWRLRQATGIAKARYVAEFVRLLLESEERVVLFGWHRAVYDIWAEQLHDFKPAYYTGTESPNQKQASAEAFTNGDSRLLIMSLRAGAGLDGLQDACSVAVFGELDWSPAMHDQCIGRLARDGQEATVAAYFLVSAEGSDPVISDVLELKRQQSEPIRNPDAPVLEATDTSHNRIKLLAGAVLNRNGDTP